MSIPSITFAACSHKGNIRSNNEDNLYCCGSILTPETRDAVFSLSGETVAPCLFAVCDGMGGQEDGEFAAWAAVSGLAELDAAVKVAPADKTDGLIQEYVTRVNGLLCDKMREKSVRIGTTLALIAVTSDEIMPYTIGDSRIYELAGGTLRQLSADHTLTAQKVKMGALTKEQAKTDSDRHKLTRYLGIFEDEMAIEAEPLPALPLTEHRRLLICSDGLTDMLDDERISEILTGTSVTDASDTMIREALEAGGKDNVTFIVIDIGSNADMRIMPPANRFIKLFSGIAGHIGRQSKQVEDTDVRH